MTPAEREIEILERVRVKLAAEGYDVVLQPAGMDLPEFLQNLRPDAVAHRGTEHLLIEVVSRSERASRRIRELRGAIQGHPNWQLETIWTTPQNIPRSLERAPLNAVSSALREIDDLLKANHLRPAFLLCWATLESLGRILLPAELSKPQTPGRLVEYLAANGFVDREEARHLRRLTDVRNRLIHGELHAEVTENELTEIRDVLWKLHDLARAR